jgi:hypothetical protein
MAQTKKPNKKCPFTKDACLGEQCAVYYVSEEMGVRPGWCALQSIAHVAAALQNTGGAAAELPRPL